MPKYVFIYFFDRKSQRRTRDYQRVEVTWSSFHSNNDSECSNNSLYMYFMWEGFWTSWMWMVVCFPLKKAWFFTGSMSGIFLSEIKHQSEKGDTSLYLRVKDYLMTEMIFLKIPSFCWTSWNIVIWCLELLDNISMALKAYRIGMLFSAF